MNEEAYCKSCDAVLQQGLGIWLYPVRYSCKSAANATLLMFRIMVACDAARYDMHLHV